MNTVAKPKYAVDKRRGRLERRKTSLKRLDTTNREALAWAAGIADGEGSFSTSKRKSGKCDYRFSVGQVDRRMLDRLCGALRLGRVYGPYGPYDNQLENAQPHFHFTIEGFEQVQAVFALLWIWLGPVKRQQAKSVLFQGV